MRLCLFLWMALPLVPVMVSAEYGSDHQVDSIYPLRIDGENSAFSIRFTSPENVNLKAAGLFCQQAQNSPAIELGLFKDKAGKPWGKRLAFSSLVPQGDRWAVFLFENTALQAGKVYHLVAGWNAHRGGDHHVGLVDEHHWAAFAASLPANPARPLDGRPDAQEALLVKTKGAWKSVDAKPVYMAWAAGNKLFGNPMNQAGGASIHGAGSPEDPSDDLWQAQALHFDCGTRGKSLRVRLRRVGNPDSGLSLSMFRHDYRRHLTRKVFETPAASPDQIGETWQWHRVTFPQDEAMDFPPHCHYFAFHSTSGRASEGGCQDCWQVSWTGASEGAPGLHDLTFGGGAHRSRAAWSTAGGHWHDQFNRDLHVIVESDPCQPARRRYSTPVPTPGYHP